jgi:hypothetical protein
MPARLKRLHVCDQWHSSRVTLLLTVPLWIISKTPTEDLRAEMAALKESLWYLERYGFVPGRADGVVAFIKQFRVESRKLGQRWFRAAYAARGLNRNLHSRMPLVLTSLLRLKRCHVRDQYHSSRESTFLPVDTVNDIATLHSRALLAKAEERAGMDSVYAAPSTYRSTGSKASSSNIGGGGGGGDGQLSPAAARALELRRHLKVHGLVGPVAGAMAASRPHTGSAQRHVYAVFNIYITTSSERHAGTVLACLLTSAFSCSGTRVLR